MIELFTTAFVTFFVAIDPPGVAPIFGALTNGSSNSHRRAMAIKSVIIATGVLLGFSLVGEWLLGALHISLDAFRADGPEPFALHAATSVITTSTCQLVQI